MIELLNLTKTLNGNSIVSDVTFTVNTGESLALVGGSGSGKTTTLKMINRLLEPSSGEILIDGEKINHLPRHILRRRIGYVFQKIGLFPHMNIAENIAAPMRLAKWDKRTIKNRVRQLLDVVRLDASLLFRKPKELSGGQQQRVGVARALATEPKIMLLDEPFGALDPIVRDQLQQTFLKLKADLNLTSILVTHDMSEALLMADRIGVMKDGKLLQFGTPHELINSPRHAYVEKLIETPLKQTRALEELYTEAK